LPLGEVVAKARVGQRLPGPVRAANGFLIVEVVAERKLNAAIQEQVNLAKIELK
jgi:hypothetical protein